MSLSSGVHAAAFLQPPQELSDRHEDDGAEVELRGGDASSQRDRGVQAAEPRHAARRVPHQHVEVCVEHHAHHPAAGGRGAAGRAGAGTERGHAGQPEGRGADGGRRGDMSRLVQTDQHRTGHPAAQGAAVAGPARRDRLLAREECRLQRPLRTAEAAESTHLPGAVQQHG